MASDCRATRRCEPIVPQLSQQCGSPAASRPGLKSRQFHADVEVAEGGGALVDDHATGLTGNGGQG